MARRNQPPDHLPEHIRDHPAVVAACRERDIGLMFVRVQNLSDEGAKFTVTHLARRCELTPAQVNRYMAGDNRVQQLEVIERIADGLHVPGDYFRIGRRPWENPAPRPVPAESLAAPGTGNHQELRRWLHMARQVDVEAVATLQAQTENIRLQDRRFGAAVLRDQITGHVRHIDDLLRHATLRTQRQPLAGVLSDASSLAAWQALDLGLTENAWRYFELSKSAAREARNEAHYAYAAGEQAYVLLDVGHATGARELLTSALDMLTEVVSESERKVPARLRCWLHAATAEACAALGDEMGTRRALDRADHALPDDAADPDLPFLALDQTHLARWRGNCLASLGDGEALTDLRRALERMDDSFIRAGASLRCDIASSLLTIGERDEAASYLGRARELAAITDSVRQRRRIERLAATL